MKRHIVSIAAVATMLASVASPAFATGATVGLSASVRADVRGDRQEFRDQQREDRQEFRDERASKSAEFRADAKARLSAARKELVKRWWTKAEKRLTMLIDRQRDFAGRIDARLDKLEGAGKDVDDQRTLLAEANVKIDASAAALASASAQIETTLTDNTASDAFRKLHVLHKAVIRKLRDSLHGLVNVIVSIKGMSGATSSPTPTPTPTPTP